MENKLLPQHLAMIRSSAISDAVAEARGYRSVETKADLKRLGFTGEQLIVPTLVIPIHSVHGGIALYHHRPDSPRIRDRKLVKYEFPTRSTMALDVHPTLRDPVRNPEIPLYITEGVRKADAAISQGLCCIGVIGTWNWRGTNEFGGKTALPDWEAVALKDRKDRGREVIICYDSDVMVKAQVHQALVRLSAFLKQRGASVSFIYLPPSDGGAKVGLDDFFAAGHSVTDLFGYRSSELLPSHSPGEEAPDKANTVAQTLIEIGMRAKLFHTDRADNFARFEVNGHKETWPIRSRAFREWLAREYYTMVGKPANTQATEDSTRLLEAKARFDGELHSLGVRTACDDDAIWVDMADPAWRAIRVSRDGWDIITSPPPLFRRHAASAQMGEPTRFGSLDLLKDCLNLREQGSEPSIWYRLVAWLVASLIPNIPHPVLVVYGEQGSAKSTFMKVLSLLIDPSRTPLRSEPRNLTEWVQIADHSWLVTLDNVSALQVWLSDAICRGVTGEGFSKRQLYSDSEDVIHEFRRVIAITGIEVVTQRSDLLDRSILLPLEPISLEMRRTEREVMASFEAVRPAILGAILDTLSAVLRQIDQVKADGLPRMADFAKVGIAVERVLGWPDGAFMRAYYGNIQEQNDEAIAASPIGEALAALVPSDDRWEGTAGELLTSLGSSVGEVATKRRDWPKSAKSLSSQIRLIAPNLRAAGISVEFSKPHAKRLITLARMSGKSCVPCVPAFRPILENAKNGTQRQGSGTQDGTDGTQMERTMERGNAGNATFRDRSIYSENDSQVEVRTIPVKVSAQSASDQPAISALSFLEQVIDGFDGRLVDDCHTDHPLKECFTCKGRRFWRRTDLFRVYSADPWICERCHPPVHLPPHAVTWWPALPA